MDKSASRWTVVVAHPCMQAGGSEATVLGIISALRGSCELGLVAGCPIELNRLNAYYGNSVLDTDFRAVVAPRWPMLLVGHTDALRGAVFARFLRSKARRFDVCIGGYNIIDFGNPAVQFIADFSFDDILRREFDAMPSGPRRWFHRPGMLRRGYLGLVRAIAGRSGYDGVDDWIVANSQWTAGVLQSRLGLVSNRVIYPPVVAEPRDVSWEGRETGFTILGRVSFEKQIERVIDILGRVRSAGHAVHLHVIGGIGDDGYGRLIRDRIAANAGWCFAEGAKMGVEKMALLAQHRFAIHGRRGEAFGIAVAEQIKAGCIPFVPSEGGPAEIVGTDELTYRDDDEAVVKIIALLEDPGQQTRLREHLAHRAGMFSTERFMSEVRILVDDWFARGS